MFFDEQKNKFRALNIWFNSDLGVSVAKTFNNELSKFSQNLYGDNLLQLGCCGSNPWLATLKYRHKWILSTCLTSKAACITSLINLPIERSSIDCILAPLTLEAFSLNDNPLDEMDRILKPMGYIIFLGINPFSLWGASLRLQRLDCFGGLSGQLISVFFIKRMLASTNYFTKSLSTFYYIPPVKEKKWLQRLEILNQCGKMLALFPGGFYCLILQKHEKQYLLIEDNICKRENLLPWSLDKATCKKMHTAFSKYTFRT